MGTKIAVPPDYSSGTFSLTGPIPSTLSTTSPKSGATLTATGQYPITWTCTGKPGPVEIQLLRGGTKVSTMITSTPTGSNGTGSYSWTIPEKQAAGSNYAVRVTSLANGTIYGVSSIFAINRASAGVITLYAGTRGDGVFTSVNGGGKWSPSGLTKMEVSYLVMDSKTPPALYAGTDGGGVYKNTNGGESWTAVKSGVPSVDVYSLAIVPPATAASDAETGSEEGLEGNQP